jgi:hypothetical protein
MEMSIATIPQKTRSRKLNRELIRAASHVERIGGQATMTAAAHGFTVKDWKPYYSNNTLRALLALELPSGLVIRECTYHERMSSRWVGLPARQYERHGEKTWAPLIEFSSKAARDRFQAAALAAVDAYMAGVAA